MKYLLLCLFAYSTFAATTPLKDLANIMAAPWVTGSQHSFSDLATDAYTLPYRYGFRLTGTWALYNTNNPPTAFPDKSYVAPKTAWFRLCPYTPRFTSDDFNLVIETFSTGACSTGCPSSLFNIALATVGGDDNLSPQTIQNSLDISTARSCAGGTQARRLVFNLATMKSQYPKGLYLLLSVSSATSTSTSSPGYEIRFYRQDLEGVLTTAQCTYNDNTTGAADFTALCRQSVTSLFDCGNGVYQPDREECDLLIDSTNCGATCQCKEPYVPDNMGGCTSCGNGVTEPLWGEVCDYNEDSNCAEDCNGCGDGFAFNEVLDECSTCGNGMEEEDEDCDFEISRQCTMMCACMGGYVSDAAGGCTTCGNGVLDRGEYCDASDPACATDCLSCRKPYISLPDSAECTLCGNFQVDDGEECDSTDYNCMSDCTACTDYHVADETGHCTRCGNGFLDAGEECDSASRTGCSDDCRSCDGGLVPAKDRYGTCTSCGNGAVDPDEVCDWGLDANCFSDCSSCTHPAVAIGRRCLTCGNGMRDVVTDDDGNVVSEEACDAAQPGCLPDCTGCEDGWTPAGDETGTCVPDCDACCEQLKARLGEEDEVGSAFTMATSLSVFLFGLLATLY